MTKEELLSKIAGRYFSSRDFNGLPLRGIGRDRDLLIELVRDGSVSVVFGDIHPNPHIRALADEPIESQLEKLQTDSLVYACAYPTPEHLRSVVDPSQYVGRPYGLELALGSPQLEHRAFDLHVLEHYRNDPRYSYDCDDIWGSISGASGEDGLRVSDSAFMRFGFAYGGNDSGRYVAAFVWDLFKLSPEQQQHWRNREVSKKTFLHPDYYRSQVLGDWPERISIYDAFIEEIQVINAIAKRVGRAPLFRRDYENARPKTFASLLRPTLREFSDFVRLLDQMLSDNINLDFFGSDVSREREVDRADGRVEVQRKGSLQILQEWLAKKFRPSDPKPVEEMHATFREIRKLRNKPSHSATEDEFDAKISEQQRQLMLNAYSALRTLRLILANFPAAKGVDMSDELREGKIWSR